jgi:hypothetical protein
MAFDAARLMLSAGIVAEADLQRAREVQTSQGGSLPRICHELGILDESRWARVVAKSLSLPTIDLGTIEVDPAARGKAPDALLRELAAFPFQLREDGQVLGVAMAEPQDDVGRAQLRASTGCELEIGVAGYGAIEQALVNHPVGAAESAPPPVGMDAEPEAKPKKGKESAQREAELAGMTPEDARLLEALSQAATRSATALRAAVDLCVERRIFTPDDLRARVKRKP